MKKRVVGALASAWILVASAASGQLITPERIEELQALKGFIYRGLTLTHAQEVAAGAAQPIVYTEVGGGDLPVSYYHYRVPTDRVDALAAAIPLPPGFSLAPISILRHAPPHHYISLTVYEVAGERSGTRAEWTTYVLKDGDPNPRVMMLETQTSEGSLDPVDLFSDPADIFEYSRADDTVITEIVSELSSFSASIEISCHPGPVIVDVAWNSASDILYWRNGVADLQSVNGLISNRRVASLPGRCFSIDNQTLWAAFVEPDPRWVLLFDERIDTAIRPWVNVTDPSVPLDPDFRDQLIATKATVFSANEMQRAAAIGLGMAEPMMDFLVEQTPPSVFLNFEITPGQLDSLAAAIPLPEGFELAPIRHAPVQEGRHYILSLNIYETVQGLASGLRAEWSVYVTRPKAIRGRRYMIVEAQSSTSFPRPGQPGFTQPAERVRVRRRGRRHQRRRPGAGNLLPGHHPPARERSAPRYRPSVGSEANNLIYWGNGVADKIYYNGLVYDTKMIHGPEAHGVDLGWHGLGRVPTSGWIEVLVFENPLEFIASPWNNLNQLEDEAAAP